MQEKRKELFQIHENKLQFRHVEQGQVDGVRLTDDEKEYLLPHFLMLLVGKPGSGKTTLLKQLLTNPQMYYRKFDDVLIISPSHAKMGIKVKPDNTTARFSLDWLFGKFDKINEEQLESVFGYRGNRTVKPKKSETGRKLGSDVMLNDNKSRFLLSDAFASMTSFSGMQKSSTSELEKQHRAEVEKQISMQKKYDELKKMPRSEQERTHRNILVVLDDVVGQVKKAEFDPRLAQLVMNRRHIIFNGTISIIMVTQKYTLIPSRVRSNASWLVLYQLNPIDFETAYRDSVTLQPYQWRDILNFVYGIDIGSVKEGLSRRSNKKLQEESKTSDIDEYEDDERHELEQLPKQVQSKIGDELKNKRFENLGIWVEANMYFKNFKRIKL